MGTKLPQSLEMQAPNGVVARDAAVDFSNLENALQNASREVARVDEARKKSDDLEAGRILEEAHQAYLPGAVERSAAYDGRQPGMAQAELAAFDAAMAPVLARADLGDGVRDSLTRQSRDLRVRVAGQAISVEAQTRGQRAAADRDAADQAAAVRAVMAFDDLFDGMEDARQAEWDGKSPQREAVLGNYNLASEQVLQGLAPPVAERVRPLLLNRQADLNVRLMAQDEEVRDAATLDTVGQAVRGLENRATRDPSGLMNNWEAEFAPIRAMLPAGLQADAEREAKDRVFARALQARIEAGEYDAVEAEIEAGRFDWMDPALTANLTQGAKSARAQGVVEDAQRAADLQAAIPADLQAILRGQAPNPELVREARLIGGDDLAVQVETDQKAAQQVRPLMARLRTMSPQAAQAELERLRAGATDAVGARVLELAGQMIQQDAQLRANPAAWALTPVGPGDRVAETVRGRQQAFADNPTPETAQAYARATWTAQTEGGVPELQRRVLTAAMAESWVEALDADGAPGPALQGLAARTALFGDGFRPQVLRELQLAGLKSADLGALTHYASSPARMGLYVRGRAVKPTEALPEREERDQLDAALRRALQPWQRALGSGDGGNAAFEAARTAAYGALARGDDIEAAVEAATAPITDGWAYQGTWAIPERRGLPVDRIRGNARAFVTDLIQGRDGDGLATPPSSTLTPEQSRRNYRDVVRETAVWRNLRDGSGVELVTPRADGAGWVRVRDARGQDVVRTWEQLNSYRPRGGGGPSGVLGFN